MSYKYEGVRINSNIMYEIIIDSILNKPYHREEISEIAQKIHVKQGGEGVEAPLKYFKGAVKRLKNDPSISVENPANGIWRFNKVKSNETKNQLSLEHTVPSESQVKSEESSGNLKPNDFGIKTLKTIYTDKSKQNSESVYIYHFPSNKFYYTKDGNSCYPIKIGKSKNSPEERVFNQLSTSNCELPVIDLVIKTSDSSSLEGLIHNILKFKKKQMKNQWNNEWFLSNPDEVEMILEMINKL